MLSNFHDIVRAWWAEHFRLPDGRAASPTMAQVEGWAAIREGADTLIAAPTGSGKTLAAFLEALDSLLREGLDRGQLPDEVRVVYVSPLKALSSDIDRNLAEPRRGIRRIAEGAGHAPVRIRAAVRTGDTSQAERTAMLRTPPHILVTTPESLYLLLTAERSRAMLRTARTVIVDEIHAVIESRRGAHLALSLERLDHVAGRRLQRIGLSATQRPIERVGRFLVGSDETPSPNGRARAPLRIVDHGHARTIDLELLLPPSPLEAVMSNEAWDEVFARIVDLVEAHRTTLVFVNTRRLAERIAGNLAERLGEGAVTAHHGSMARAARHSAEERLRTGELRALVATSSLELGIDIGHIDLVVQIGSPRRIATLLQRVGRSGHTVAGQPKGRLIPLTRDELIECIALIGAVRERYLDEVIVPPLPLDVLAQQIVAEAAAEDWSCTDLFALARRAWPYRHLDRATFDDVVRMVARGFATRRGRRGALLHLDEVNGQVRGRRGARITAITSGGAIPDVADYRVVLEPDGTTIGTLDEDFAIESMAGDVFQLGATSWRILRVENGTVRVADAHGEPPGLPFWFGEAPARSDELSAAVAALRDGVAVALTSVSQNRETATARNGSTDNGTTKNGATCEARAWLVERYGVPESAAEQAVRYLAESLRLLGALPTQRTLVLERFFDDSGGMQLVLHAPFGARVNRAWGLALRKKFCRTFNFELQAAATEEGVLLSLGPQHSFPLDDVFRYLHPASVRDVLVQAVLDSPLFQVRWRWNTSLSLAVPRRRGGSKVPPPIQRMQAEDVLAAVFPDAAACLENIAGDRDVPDHPLVRQALRDCLEEAMDLPALEALLRDVHAGGLTLVARDTPEPSPLSHELLNARPYAFLDDAPLEERRARAVYTRRALEPSSVADLGALDVAAIERVRDEARPAAETADELHDALLTCGYFEEHEGRAAGWAPLFDELCGAGRARRIERPARSALWAATERAAELHLVFAGSATDAARPAAIRELLRGRLEVSGPTTGPALAHSLGVTADDAEAALLALEAEGTLLRGTFTPAAREREWCDRRLLARIHRYTIQRLRAEIEPVSIADFVRFLACWQKVEPGHRSAGAAGLLQVIEQLHGFEAAAAAWEADLLPDRCQAYTPELLDQLCASGRVMWARLSSPAGSPPGLLRSSPISLLIRTEADVVRSGRQPDAHPGPDATRVLETLRRRGASFAHEIANHANLSPTQIEHALAELAAAGFVTADTFTGLRALLTPAARRASKGASAPARRRTAPWSVEGAGRWAVLDEPLDGANDRTDVAVRMLLRRWGVLFRRLLDREPAAPPWRDVLRAARRMEARGEIRGGRFVASVTGEQFALPDAVPMLRAVRRAANDGQFVGIGAADPLNLTGLLIPGERIPATAANRIAIRDGIPVAVLENRRFRTLRPLDENETRAARQVLTRARVPAVLRSYLRHRGGKTPRLAPTGD